MKTKMSLMSIAMCRKAITQLTELGMIDRTVVEYTGDSCPGQTQQPTGMHSWGHQLVLRDHNTLSCTICGKSFRSQLLALTVRDRAVFRALLS